MSLSENPTNRDVDESESRIESSGTRGNGGKKRSFVWDHFSQQGVCKYCTAKLSANKTSGTSNMRRHLISRCLCIDEEVRAQIIASQGNDLFDPSTFQFDPELTRSLLTLLFIDAEVPFSLIESPFWEPAMRSMRPEYRAVGRQTVRDDCGGVFGSGSDVLFKEFNALDSRVSFTSDIWTSNTDLGFLCLTAHYIDPGFNFQKKILAMKKIPYPHTGPAVANMIEKILCDWKLDGKIFTITLDNCSVNDNAVSHLERRLLEKTVFRGRHMHMRCAAHILNLMVQDGTDVIQTALKSIRKLMLYIDSSGSRLQVLNTFLHDLNMAPKRGLKLNCPTRWNSTFEMLQEALRLKEALSRFVDNNSTIGGPTLDEWKQAEDVARFLEAFLEATKTFSAVRKPCSHLYIKKVWGIRRILMDDDLKGNPVLRDLAEKMQKKFSKYWETPNLILTIAAVFDPRYKVLFVRYCFRKAYGDEFEAKLNIVSYWLRQYYEDYESRNRRVEEEQTTSRCSSQLETRVSGKQQLEREFAQFQSENPDLIPKRSELDNYLAEKLMDINEENFDVLQWWRKNSEFYPTLAKMARDFLAVQVSNVASESAFSGAGRLTDNRSSMNEETLESLLCSKDWLGPKEDVFDLNKFRPFMRRSRGSLES